MQVANPNLAPNANLAPSAAPEDPSVDLTTRLAALLIDPQARAIAKAVAAALPGMLPNLAATIASYANSVKQPPVVVKTPAECRQAIHDVQWTAPDAVAKIQSIVKQGGGVLSIAEEEFAPDWLTERDANSQISKHLKQVAEVLSQVQCHTFEVVTEANERMKSSGHYNYSLERPGQPNLDFSLEDLITTTVLKKMREHNPGFFSSLTSLRLCEKDRLAFDRNATQIHGAHIGFTTHDGGDGTQSVVMSINGGSSRWGPEIRHGRLEADITHLFICNWPATEAPLSVRHPRLVDWLGAERLARASFHDGGPARAWNQYVIVIQPPAIRQSAAKR